MPFRIMNDPASVDAAVDLQSVTKVYSNGVMALDQLSMRVERGEIFGLLGPNGAGKTTLVKVLMRLVRPTECRGAVLGKPVGDGSVVSRLGYLPENAAWPEHLTTEQVLDFAGRLSGLPGKVRRARVEELLRQTGMEPWRDDPPSVFSKGMRQRLGLAYALMGDPDLIFLDEPTDGVDPAGRKEMRDLIRDLKRQGKTVFVNSHLLGELELICDRMAILARGRVIRSGSLEELTLESCRYEVVVRGNMLEDPSVAEVVTRLGGTVALSPDRQESHIHLPTRRPHLVQPVVDVVRRRGYLLLSVAPARQSLEELFLEAMRGGGWPADQAAIDDEDDAVPDFH